MIARGCLSLFVCGAAFAATIEIEQGEGMVMRYGDATLQAQPTEPRSVHGVYLAAVHDGRVIANEQFNTAAHRHHGGFFRRVVDSLPPGATFLLVIHVDGTRYWDDDAAAAFRALTGESYGGGSYRAWGIVGDPGIEDGAGHGQLVGDDGSKGGPMSASVMPGPTPIPPGYSRRHFEMVGYNLGRPLLVHLYRPKNFTIESDILFMMHGQTRQGDSEMALLHDMAERHGALVVAPEYEGEHHPTSHHYERGGVDILSEAYWSFMAIEHIFDYVQACTDNTSDRYLIMGHSAGGYFTHRFAVHMQEARYRVAVALNSGSYALPDPGDPFATDERLRASLQRRAFIMIGDYRLPTESPDGPTGLRVRGEKAIAAHRARAEALGADCAWELRFVPDIAHVPGPMFNAAESILFPH